MKNNKLEIDLNEILVDVIKLDKNLQNSIKDKVSTKIIDDITQKFLDEYYEKKWSKDEEELKERIVDELSAEREEFIKRILKDFTEKLRNFSADKRNKAYEEFKNSVKKLEESAYVKI